MEEGFLRASLPCLNITSCSQIREPLDPQRWPESWLLEARAASGQQHQRQRSGQNGGQGGRTWKASRGHKRRAAAADVQEEEYENAGEWNGAEATSHRERRIVGKEQKSTTWPTGQRREWTQK